MSLNISTGQSGIVRLRLAALTQCGNVLVNPDDFIVADLIGVTVIPLEKAEEVVKLAREQTDREEETPKWVAMGKTIEDLLEKIGHI